MGFSFTVFERGVAFIVCGVMVWFLPSMRKDAPLATGMLEAPRRGSPRYAVAVSVICTLMWEPTACISLICRCLSSMSFASSGKTCRRDDASTAAGWRFHNADCRLLRQTVGKRLLMRTPLSLTVLLCGYVAGARAPATLLGLQLLNAIYIGNFGGIGMPLFFRISCQSQRVQPLTPLYTVILSCRLIEAAVRWRESPQKSGNYHAVFWFALS